MDFIDFRINLTIIFIALTYFQALFFFSLYRIEKTLFPMQMVPLLCFIGFLITPFIFEFCQLEVLYNVPLIWFNILLVRITYQCIKGVYHGNKLISLSFLLPYLNSIFWEFPLHISDFVINGLTNNLIVQSVHFLPLTFFLPGLKRNLRVILERSIWNWLITLVLFEVRINYNFGVYDLWLGFINRFISFSILIYTLITIKRKQQSNIWLWIRQQLKRRLIFSFP